VPHVGQSLVVGVFSIVIGNMFYIQWLHTNIHSGDHHGETKDLAQRGVNAAGIIPAFFAASESSKVLKFVISVVVY
jgi:hypothetical protein